MKKPLALCLALLLALSGPIGCGGSAAEPSAAPAVETPAATPEAPTATPGIDLMSVTASLTMAAGEASGAGCGLGSALAAVIGQNTGVSIAVVPTDGSGDSLARLADGQAELAVVPSNVLADAYAGAGAFAETGADDSLRALGALYAQAVQIVTLDASLSGVADLAGRSVCVGEENSAACSAAADVLAAYGLTFDDITPVYASFGDAAGALRDGTISAAFLCAAVPSAAVAELAASSAVRLLSLDEEHRQALLDSRPCYAPLTLSAGTYAGLGGDVTAVAVKATLVCRADLADETAYAIVRTAFEHAGEIAALHAKGAELDPASAAEGVPIPFAVGAARYYAEKSVAVQTAVQAVG